MATKKKQIEVAPKVEPVKVPEVDYKAKYEELVMVIRAELARWKMKQRQFETQGTNMAVNVLKNVLPE
jgi:hypothetical protein